MKLKFKFRLASLPTFLLLFTLSSCASASENTGLYPPTLMPLINRANSLLSTGAFAEAVKIYTEAIDQSPTDYLLHYKRATALFSLSRYSAALDDFDKVIQYSTAAGHRMDTAYLMKARIYLKEGSFALARDSLKTYTSSTTGKNDAAKTAELMGDINEAEKLALKSEKERKAQLWTACVESVTGALRIATYSIPLRELRVECSLASGDVEGAVGDLSRISSLTTPSTSLLLFIFRLHYFFLPQPSASTGGTTPHMQPLKQCLHYDPDSSRCLSLHRITKSLDKSFTQLEALLESKDYRGIIRLLAPGSGSKKEGNLLTRFDELLEKEKGQIQLPVQNEPPIPLPDPSLSSPRRQHLYRSLCRAYTQTASSSSSPSPATFKSIDNYCIPLLNMTSCEEDTDGLVGKAFLLGERDAEWEQAVRILENVWDKIGRGAGEVHTMLQSFHKKLKLSKQKDYYKVLGVGRDADQKTIKKAYRKGAMKAHPDKGGSEAQMAALNEAYEVLSNPELRQRFDNGDDPNDPMSSQGGHPFTYPGQHPFAHFFQGGPGGGGPGGGFKFEGFSGGGGRQGGFPGGFQFHFGGH